MGNSCCDNQEKSQLSEISKQPKKKTMQEESIEPSIEFQNIHEFEGQIQLPDGSSYKGFLLNGIPEGRGTEYHKNNERYIGNFKDGIKNGTGTYVFADKCTYVGEFKNGNIEGWGQMKWTNGDHYKGEFKNNVFSGFGKYYSKDNNSFYQGEYLNGLKHGEGVIIMGKDILKGYWDKGVYKYNIQVKNPQREKNKTDQL